MGASIGILVNFNKTYESAFASDANEVTGFINKQYNGVEYYFRLKQTNKKLAEENARLYETLKESYALPDTSAVTKIDSLLKDSLGRIRKFTFLPAKVVNNSVNEQNNYITLYRGSNQGVEKDMGVIGPEGIVGTVILVSENYCRVMSLINRFNKVSAMLKNNFYTGLVEWDGKSSQYVTLHGIPKSIAVKQGDSVLTSNLSGNFPPGLMIGTVDQISAESSSNFFTIRVKTSTNFYTLQYAYLVKNELWAEQKSLEAKTPKNQ